MSDTALKSPPIGDQKYAEKYIDHLMEMLKWDKATLNHSDLKKYDPSTMQDHYRVNLGDYDAEVSHSINPNNGQNIYMLIFTNVAQIKAGQAQEAILSYIYLNEPLFSRFKTFAEGYFERKHREEEEKRFKTAMQPIDNIIAQSLSETNAQPAPADRPEKKEFVSDFLNSKSAIH